MELLQNDSDDDDDGEIFEEEYAKKISYVKNKWTDEQSDDNEEEEKEVEDENKIINAKPSANDLFSTISLQFINKETVNDQIKPFSTEKIEPEQQQNYNKSSENNKSINKVNIQSTTATSASASTSNLKNVKIKSNIPDTREGKKGSRDNEKETAKDRVKRQRISGQSGIGADFKTWKSEEEMKQRQQYDQAVFLYICKIQLINMGDIDMDIIDGQQELHIA